MAPDLRTVSAMLAASALLMSVLLCTGIRTPRADGFLKWNLGLGSLAAGWLLATLRGWLPDVASVAAAEALLLAGFYLQLAAVAEFGQQRPRSALWALPGPLLFVVLIPLMRHPVALSLVASLACAAALAGTASAARHLAGGGAPRRVLMLACEAGVLLMFARGASGLFLPQLRSDLLAAAMLEPAILVGLFATSAAASIGFLLLHRERAVAGLRQLAAFDPLTEVFNRLAFLGLAEAQLARARRSGEPCALLTLALDPYRHPEEGRRRRETNDRVLRDLAGILRAGVRAGDLVGRSASEEFCILLSNAAPGAVLEVADRLRTTIAARRLGELSPPITVSIGVAPCEVQRAGALQVALAHAEQALHRARKNGRDRVVAAPASAPPGRARRAA